MNITKFQKTWAQLNKKKSKTNKILPIYLKKQNGIMGIFESDGMTLRGDILSRAFLRFE